KRQGGAGATGPQRNSSDPQWAYNGQETATLSPWQPPVHLPPPSLTSKGLLSSLPSPTRPGCRLRTRRPITRAGTRRSSIT
ncbi:hypothetical protein BaRGS_00002087, partial [Batillaria attramentaria]